jgi:hypothetical protein
MSLLISRPLAKEAMDTIIQDKLRWILQSADPLAVVVFGSAARGEMTERSDVDIALVFPDEESLKAGRTSIFGRPPIDPWPTDLLFYTKDAFYAKRESGGVCELIGEEGILVHGRLE